MKGPRFLSQKQLEEGNVFGIRTTTENDLDKDKAAGEEVQVYDLDKETRVPVFVRIQNLGTEPIRYSEDLGKCSANQFTGILGPGSASDDGFGTTIEYRAHIPRSVYIHATNAYRVSITKRYAPQN